MDGYSQNMAAKTNGWKKSLVWVVLAVGCFQAAYSSLKHPMAGLFIFGYAYGLVRLTEQPTVRRAFYFGLATAYLCYAPQLFFMWRIFGPAAIVLWVVLAFWVGLFAAVICGSRRRWGEITTAWLIPVVWTGLEYFRGELYYLKFSWLNLGYALPMGDGFGMYGFGFLMFAGATWLSGGSWFRKFFLFKLLAIVAFIAIYTGTFLVKNTPTGSTQIHSLTITGIQMEFPGEHLLPKMLDRAFAKNTNADIFVLSEYTLEAGVPEALKDWCRKHSRYLVVGGKDVVTNDVYYNTAFVVGTNGEVIFKQAKSVPIQFFHDGLPAPNQEVWNSPWGKIGICICYDLSYARVTDRLVEEGAQLLIVPTMDVSDWGTHQHELHSRVARVRATEYGIPIFRVASSGISQAIDPNGLVIGQIPIGINGGIFSAYLALPTAGTLPWDRYVAPVCVGITGIILVSLLVASRRRKVEPKSE